MRHEPSGEPRCRHCRPLHGPRHSGAARFIPSFAGVHPPLPPLPVCTLPSPYFLCAPSPSPRFLCAPSPSPCFLCAPSPKKSKCRTFCNADGKAQSRARRMDEDGRLAGREHGAAHLLTRAFLRRPEAVPRCAVPCRGLQIGLPVAVSAPACSLSQPCFAFTVGLGSSLKSERQNLGGQGPLTWEPWVETPAHPLAPQLSQRSPGQTGGGPSTTWVPGSSPISQVVLALEVGSSGVSPCGSEAGCWETPWSVSSADSHTEGGAFLPSLKT